MADYIIEQMENDFADVTVRTLEEEVKGHGRVDHVTYYQLPIPDTIPGRQSWKGLKTIGVAIRNSESKGKTTADVRYYLSSLRLGVKQFAKSVRGHWGIENSLHWCLDVTFREDENRTRDRHAANNLAWLKRFAISVLKQKTNKESIAMRRRMAGWNNDYLAQVFGKGIWSGFVFCFLVLALKGIWSGFVFCFLVLALAVDKSMYRCQ